jgi:hypothetical protein
MQQATDDPVVAPIDPAIPQRSFTEKDFEGESRDRIKRPNANRHLMNIKLIAQTIF